MNRTHHLSTLLLYSALIVGLAACGQSSEGGDFTNVDGTGIQLDGGAAKPDGAAKADGAPLGDGPTVHTDGINADGQVGIDTGKPTSDFGTPCEGPEECNSGYCVPSPDGTVCTQTCTADCPPGWACDKISGGGGDPVYICVSATALLCHPCEAHDDCNVGGQASPNRCVSYGHAGSFCGIDCEVQNPDAGCPSGYLCQPSPEGEAGQGDCVPLTWECGCNGLAKQLGPGTVCQVANEHGACDGWRACGSEGLTDCEAPLAEAETCNEMDDDCDGDTDEGFANEPCFVINKHGGCPGSTVCQDGESVCEGPEPAEDVCDGLDQDCDGTVDEGFPDTDVDGVLDCLDKDDDDDGFDDDDDCAPLDPTIHPFATEVCDQVDNDCDSSTDEAGSEGCTNYYLDVDQDDFGDSAMPAACLCAPAPQAFYTATQPGDCDDLQGSVHPDATEICNGADDDCDGLTDEGTGGDTDGDGLPDCSDPDDDGDGWPDTDDCAPLDASIHPDASELCNGVDDDCDGFADEEGGTGCSIFWLDMDDDGQGTPGPGTKCLCGPDEVTSYTATNSDDCNDLNKDVYLGADETCNGLDDNCDGQVDEGSSTDSDGDGILDCIDEDDDNDGWNDPMDCAPLDGAVHPEAEETCNVVDDDCDGVVDEENATGCSTYWRDADGDGHGTDAFPSKCLCGPDPVSLYQGTTPDDCDDADPSQFPQANESCNFADDDCDAEVDEGVASPCGDCNPTCVLETGEDKDDPLDPDQDNSDGVDNTEDGGITLVSNSFSMPFIWIANSAEDTISKLHTDTGCEVARYDICDNPSRTSVDLGGNGIIACRSNGIAAKVAVFEVDCTDDNDNGVIDTSRDLNEDCEISVDEMVANDECILWKVKPVANESNVRAAGVDKENNIWVGLWNTQQLVKLDGETGEVLVNFPLNGRPYGLAIDALRYIWVASRAPNGVLLKVDPDIGEIGFYNSPRGSAYGLAVDPLGKVWMAGGEATGIGRFDPDTETWTNYGALTGGYARGVAVRREDGTNGELLGAEVFVAHHSWGNCAANGQHRYVGVIDAVTLAQKPSIDLGADRGPVGVAIDSLGFLWSINQCHSTASKIDTKTHEVLGTYPVGLSPYTYSDMTGYALKTITTQQGFYSEIFSGWTGAETKWDQLLVNAELPGNGASWMKVQYRLAPTIAELSGQAWVDPIGPFPPDTFPLKLDVVGNHIEMKMILGTDDDAFKPVLHSISVIAYEIQD